MSVNHHDGLRKWGITHLLTLRQMTLKCPGHTKERAHSLNYKNGPLSHFCLLRQELRGGSG
jgi:hypothetical protein